MSKPVGDRACLAGVGQSFNRPMDMLIFFGERRAGASGDFANALERQAIRVIMDAKLCGPVTPGGDDVRVLNALTPSQLSGDRQRVGWGKGVFEGVEFGGCGIMKKK